MSLLSRYGTCVAFLPRPEDDVSALIQLPNAERDWLILWASFSVCVSTGVYHRVYIGLFRGVERCVRGVYVVFRGVLGVCMGYIHV